jgi:hypothetical protein
MHPVDHFDAGVPRWPGQRRVAGRAPARQKRREVVRAKVRLGLVESPDPPMAADPAGDADVEWRNKQPEHGLLPPGWDRADAQRGRHRRRHDHSENYRHLEQAVERGLNDLAMAPAYHQGRTEQAYGRLLAGSSARRDKVC